jgi:hypothetical protein
MSCLGITLFVIYHVFVKTMANIVEPMLINIAVFALCIFFFSAIWKVFTDSMAIMRTSKMMKEMRYE